MKKYYDVEEGKIWTEDELREEHKQLLSEVWTEEEKEIYSDFKYWLQCATDKNGSLEEIAPDWDIENKRKWTALRIAAQSDMKYEDIFEVLCKWNVHGTWTMWEINHRPVDIDELQEMVETELGWR